MSGIRAVAQEQPTVSSEHATHYIWLAAGPKEITVGGVGEQAVGFHKLPRRTLREIIPTRYGARIESVLGEESLSNPSMERVSQTWHLDSRRVQTKSASAICKELSATWAAGGLVVLRSLTGKDFTEADEIVDSIISDEIAQKAFIEVLQHLRSLSFSLDDPRFRTHSEMLAGAERGYTLLFDHVQSLKTEVGAALQANRPMRPLGPVEKELFEEVAETLPEDLAAKRNAELGVSIARTVSETSSQSSSTDKLVEQLIRQNELKEQELALLRSQVVATTAQVESKASKK